jgi:hypothetical protein
MPSRAPSQLLPAAALVALAVSACGSATRAPAAKRTAATTTVAQAPATDPTTSTPAPSTHAAIKHSAVKRAPAASATTTTSAPATTSTATGTVSTRTSADPPPAHHHASATRPKAVTARKVSYTPAGCLKFAGLGHILKTSSDRWQGTMGNASPGNLLLTVFLQGPYPTSAAASNAAASDRNIEFAFAGGRYVAYAPKQGSTGSLASWVASCLSAGSGKKYSF